MSFASFVSDVFTAGTVAIPLACGQEWAQWTKDLLTRFASNPALVPEPPPIAT
jgi:hypothetical protein